MTACKRTPLGKTLLIPVLFFGLSAAAQAGDRVTIGITSAMTATLSIITQKQGYFSQQGIDAEVRIIESGSKAVAMMLNDEIDISESAIFSLVSSSFNRRDFRIYTQVSISGNDNMIIARKDRGIQKIMDLQGKQVRVLKGALPQYVLDLMLLNAGVDPKKIHMVL